MFAIDRHDSHPQKADIIISVRILKQSHKTSRPGCSVFICVRWSALACSLQSSTTEGSSSSSSGSSHFFRLFFCDLSLFLDSGLLPAPPVKTGRTTWLTLQSCNQYNGKKLNIILHLTDITHPLNHIITPVDVNKSAVQHWHSANKGSLFVSEGTQL